MSKKENGTLSFIVDTAGSGHRIDKFLTEKIKDTSRSRIQDIIGSRKVQVNGKVITKHYRLTEDDRITIEDLLENNSRIEVEPQNINLKVVYEDQYLLVISKEPGILTHPTPSRRKDTIVNALLYHYSKLSGLSGKERAGIVHRLDKDTSGLLIIARDDNTHRLLSEMFKKRRIKKTYTALAWGSFSENEGQIVLPIGRSRLDRKKMSISIDRGREAFTGFEVRERLKDSALLDVYPATGRTHQIRVHLAYIGHPIIGDELYGTRGSRDLAKELGLKRQFLHAGKLKFTHPVTGETMELEDRIPGDLKKCLENLRRRSKM